MGLADQLGIVESDFERSSLLLDSNLSMELKEGPRMFLSVKFLCSVVGGSFCLGDREREH